MEYFNQFKNRRRSSQILQSPAPAHDPVLTADDEAFLQRVTSQPENAPNSAGEASTAAVEAPQGSHQQSPVKEHAQDIPPSSPVEQFGKELGEQERRASQKSESSPTKEPERPKSQEAAAPEKKKKRWSAVFWKKNGDSKKVGLCLLLLSHLNMSANAKAH